MKPHDAYLDLAAIAIDWPLTPHDRGRLEQHLAGCPTCARAAAQFRADAVALSTLPPDRHAPGAQRDPDRPATP